MARANVYNQEALNRYLANLERARELRHTRVRALIKKIEYLNTEVDRLSSEIDGRIAEVNQLRGRRHNIIGVGWVIDRRTLDQSFTQPRGPVWNQAIHSRDGRRYTKRIRKVTLAIIHESYQGRDAGVLRRHYAVIERLAQERNRLLSALVRVNLSLQHVGLKQR